MGISRQLIPLPVGAVEGAVTHTLDMECDQSAAVGDWVRLSDVTDNKVDVAADNQDKRPVIGRIKAKLANTTCTVVLSGVQDTDVVDSGILRLGPDGVETTAIISGPAYAQIIGYSFGNGKMQIDPSPVVTKLR